MDVDLHDRRQSHAQASTNDSISAAQSMPGASSTSSYQSPAASAQAAPQAGGSFLGLGHTSLDNQTLKSKLDSSPSSNAQHKLKDKSGALLNASRSQHTSMQDAPVHHDTSQHDPAQHDAAQHDAAQHDAAQHDPGPLPMLASACPGWVCYAEKTHGSYILPYISTAKSPQVTSPNPTTFPRCPPPLSSPLPPRLKQLPCSRPVQVFHVTCMLFKARLLHVTCYQAGALLCWLGILSNVVLIACHLCSVMMTGKLLLTACTKLTIVSLPLVLLLLKSTLYFVLSWVTFPMFLGGKHAAAVGTFVCM